MESRTLNHCASCFPSNNDPPGPVCIVHWASTPWYYRLSAVDQGCGIEILHLNLGMKVDVCMCSICTDTSQQCKSLSLYQYSIDQRRSRVPPVHACLGFSVSLSLSLPGDLGLAASRTSFCFL